MNQLNNTQVFLDKKLSEVRDKKRDLAVLRNTLKVSEEKLQRLLDEQKFCLKALQALQDIRPLLAAYSAERAVSLANSALKVVFDTEDTLFFSEEESRFFIKTPEGDTDLVAANGGGYLAVISFIFSIFLLVSTGSRRVVFYDEQFTMISDEALQRFMHFLKSLCKDLHLDILLITHDSRITIDAVDKFYFVSDGVVKKIK